MDNVTKFELLTDNLTSTVLDIFSVTSGDSYGKHGFISVYPWTASLSILIICLASLLGTGGNLLTILAIALNKRIRNVESMFFFNLALSDLYVTAVADPMNVVGKLLSSQ